MCKWCKSIVSRCSQVPFEVLDCEARQACENSMNKACQISQLEEDDLWHTAAGSAVVVDEEDHLAAKQNPIQRIGERLWNRVDQ